MLAEYILLELYPPFGRISENKGKVPFHASMAGTFPLFSTVAARLTIPGMHSLYGVTTSLIVISSKSDTFFERHLPGRLFVPSPPIRHFPSFSSRDIHHELSSNRDNFRSVLIPSNPLIYAEFGTFRHLLLGCITRRKDIEKASCCDVMS